MLAPDPFTVYMLELKVSSFLPWKHSSFFQHREVLHVITEFLVLPTIHDVMRCSVKLREMLTADAFWQHFYIKLFPLQVFTPSDPCSSRASMYGVFIRYIYILIDIWYMCFTFIGKRSGPKCRQINHIWTVWVCTDIQNSPLVGDWMERQPPLNNLCIDGTKLTAVVFTERTSLQWTVLIRRDHHQVKRF